MAHHEGTPETARNAMDRVWPQVRSGPLVVGGILTGIGAVVAMAGVAVAGTHVVAATLAWIKELETPPGQLARLRWEQAKTAAPPVRLPGGDTRTPRSAWSAAPLPPAD